MVPAKRVKQEPGLEANEDEDDNEEEEAEELFTLLDAYLPAVDPAFAADQDTPENDATSLPSIAALHALSLDRRRTNFQRRLGPVFDSDASIHTLGRVRARYSNPPHLLPFEH